MISHESLLEEKYIELTKEPIKIKKGCFCPIELMFKEYNGLGKIIEENNIKNIRTFILGEPLDCNFGDFRKSNTYNNYLETLKNLEEKEKINLEKTYEFWIVYGTKE
jgi:hypothetical protein